MATIDDPELSESWKNILAALDGISKKADDVIEKAKVNVSGSAQDTVHVNTPREPLVVHSKPSGGIFGDGKPSQIMELEKPAVALAELKTESAQLMALKFATRGLIQLK